MTRTVSAELVLLLKGIRTSQLPITADIPIRSSPSTDEPAGTCPFHSSGGHRSSTALVDLQGRATLEKILADLVGAGTLKPSSGGCTESPPQTSRRSARHSRESRGESGATQLGAVGVAGSADGFGENRDLEI